MDTTRQNSADKMKIWFRRCLGGAIVLGMLLLGLLWYMNTIKVEFSKGVASVSNLEGVVSGLVLGFMPVFGVMAAMPVLLYIALVAGWLIGSILGLHDIIKERRKL